MVCMGCPLEASGALGSSARSSSNLVSYLNSSAHQQHWKDIARGSVAHEYLFNVWDVKRAQSLCLDSPTIRTGASGPV